MITRATAVVEPGGVLRSVSSAPPLTVRRTAHDDKDVCALCLVGSAAGPLPGDDITFDLTVADGARAELTWTGASLAQGRLNGGRLNGGRLNGDRSATYRSTARIGERAVLHAETAPVVVCAGSSVRVDVNLELAMDATLTWRESVVLGRHDESAGAISLNWRVDRGGTALLRQQVDLSPGWLRDWPGLLAGAKVLATAFVSGPGIHPETYVESATAVCQQLDAGSALLTVLDRDYASAVKRMDALLARVRG